MLPSICSPLVAIHLVPNIWMKMKLTRLCHPNISILTTENGGRGTHFAKFLISPFQWGLTHSAMYWRCYGRKTTNGRTKVFQEVLAELKTESCKLFNFSLGIVEQILYFVCCRILFVRCPLESPRGFVWNWYKVDIEASSIYTDWNICLWKQIRIQVSQKIYKNLNISIMYVYHV